jgi:ubiquinone/menaquinone biosynthesis C-methylase UbiE
VEQGRTFDTVAASYDAVRSGYPAHLFSDVANLADLRPGDRVLEVGCGSGQATAGFIDSGLDVTGIDPAASLIEIARSKLGDCKLAHFEVSSFEKWPLQGQKYSLVAAAQSWHWVDPKLGFAKAADALSPSGSLAIFGHTPVFSTPLVDALTPIYARLRPKFWGSPPEAWYLPTGPIAGLIKASGRFKPPEHRHYRWRRSYTTASFAEYLGTRSELLLLPERDRAELLSKVRESLPAVVETDWVTTLYLARLA